MSQRANEKAAEDPSQMMIDIGAFKTSLNAAVNKKAQFLTTQVRAEDSDKVNGE